MGTLAKVSVQNKEYEEGFISFLRLVGVVYMKKHISGFNGKLLRPISMNYTNKGNLFQNNTYNG